MAVVGPGAQQAVATDIKSQLDGASEFEYVTILNPLTDDFAVRVAQDIPVNMPIEIKAQTGLIQSGNDVVRTYGLDLRNPDFQGRKRISNDTIIPAGRTINLKGNEAQVAVRQIVNELMQREGNGKLLSDPTLRAEAENRVIQTRGSIQDLMDTNLRTQRSQLDEAIANSNKEVPHDKSFPGLNRDTGTEAGDASEAGGTDAVQQERRSPGRPRKPE